MTILVAGDAMIDRYWHGTVTRVAPDAPVPILKRAKEEDRLGAAAHVRATVEALGEAAKAIYSPTFLTDPIVKIRLIARTQQIARIDLDHPQEPIGTGQFREASEGAKVVVFCDYAKGALERIRSLIVIAKQRNALVLIDPKSSEVERYRGADVIKPNHFEMEAMVGRWGSEDVLEERAAELCATFQIGAVLMTRGSLGMSLFTKDGAHHISGRHLELYDVSGAGDAAIAALAVALARGHDLKLAAFYANRAAGVAISRFGTTLVREHEVFGL